MGLSSIALYVRIMIEEEVPPPFQPHSPTFQTRPDIRLGSWPHSFHSRPSPHKVWRELAPPQELLKTTPTGIEDLVTIAALRTLSCLSKLLGMLCFALLCF